MGYDVTLAVEQDMLIGARSMWIAGACWCRRDEISRLMQNGMKARVAVLRVCPFVRLWSRCSLASPSPSLFSFPLVFSFALLLEYHLIS